MEESHSFIINIPIPRLCAKESIIQVKESQLQRRLKRTILRRPRVYSETFLRKYTPPQKRPLRVKTIKKEEFLLPFRLFAKEQDKHKQKYDLNIPIHQKYKMKLCEYKNRLRVEYPPDDVIAITDIDEGFFKYVNGRSITDRAPLYKTLKAVLTHQLRTKQEVGYRYDEMLNIDLIQRSEMKIYEQSKKKFLEQTKYLNSFVSEDYGRSISLLKKCDDFHKNVNMQLIDLQLLADKQFTIVSSLMSLDYMYYLQQRYGRFLYYLSPPTWRASHRKFARSMEIEVKGFDLGGGDGETFDVIFDKMQKECLSDLVSPALYFSQPSEIIKLFEGIEKQQLNYLDYVTHLAPLIRQSRENIKALKTQMSQDSAHILSTIKYFETLLDFSEQQCAQLETKFYKIINGLFYESVGSPEVIKLCIDLESCYEKIYLEKPLNADIVTIAKGLESFYMDYWKRLDAIQSDGIKEAVKQSVKMEREKLKRAQHANRELCVFDRLTKGLRRAFAPPPSKLGQRTASDDETKGDEVVPKSSIAIIPKKHKKKSKNEVTLTDAELEYLALFTDWTPNDDPTKYLHSE